MVRARLAQRGRAAAAGGPRGAAGPIVAEVLGRLLEPAVAVADLLPRLPALAVGAAAAEEELSAQGVGRVGGGYGADVHRRSLSWKVTPGQAAAPGFADPGGGIGLQLVQIWRAEMLVDPQGRLLG